MAKKYKKKRSKYPGYMSFTKGLGLNPAYGKDGGPIDGMMKARIAYGVMHGNPSAKRMVAPTDNPYIFQGNEPYTTPDIAGEHGTHHMFSEGNYAIPDIQQDSLGNLFFNVNAAPTDREAMRFESPEDAQYFAENYKSVAPAFREDGGWLDELPAEYEDGGKLMYQQDMGRLPIYVDNPNDPRLQAYSDSLNLYKAYVMQDKLMGRNYSNENTSNKFAPPRSLWTPSELQKRRKPIWNSALKMNIAEDFQNEKEMFSDPGMPWSRPEDRKLLSYYRNLGFTDNNIMFHSSPDVIHPTIRAVGSYHDGTAWSPIYRKPKQPYIYGKPEIVEDQIIYVDDSNDPRLIEYNKRLELSNKYPMPSKSNFMTRSNSSPEWFKNQINTFKQGNIEPIGFDLSSVNKNNLHNPVFEKPKVKVVLRNQEVSNTPVVQQPIAIDPSMLTYRISMLPESEQRGNQKYVATVVPETYTKYGTGFAERYPLTQEQVDKMGESDTMKSYEGKDVPVKYIKGFKQGGFIGKTTVEAGGAKHVVYTGKDNHIMVTHPEMDNGAWDTIDLTKVSGAESLAQGVDATLDWHRKHPYHKYKKAEGGYMSPLDLSPRTLKRYKKDLMIQENEGREGYDKEKNLWFPHVSVEKEKTPRGTIAYGHKVKKGEDFSKGITEEEALKLLDQDILAEQAKAESIIDEKYGKGAYDRLSQEKQMLLTDYAYNAVLREFDDFTRGVMTGDKDLMLEQYKRYTGGKPLVKRNAWTKEVIKNLPTLEQEKEFNDKVSKELDRITKEREYSKLPWYSKAYEYIKQTIPFEEGGSYRGKYRRPMYNDKRIGRGPDGGEVWVYKNGGWLDEL